MNSQVATLFLIISLALFVGAAWLLIARKWIWHWMKATLALAALIFSVPALFISASGTHFKPYTLGQPIARVAIVQRDAQRFGVRITELSGSRAEVYEVAGDEWRLEAQLVAWDGLLRKLGFKPSYRLDRLSGRYKSTQDALEAEKTVYDLEELNSGLGLWQWSDEMEALPWVENRFGAGVFMPLANGAAYLVSVRQDGLFAKPLNGPAVDALANWQ